MKSLTSVIFKNDKRNDYNMKDILSVLALFIVFMVLASTMTFFSYKITKELEYINQTYLFINILLLMNFFLLFAKSIFECLNVLYFSKDLKILLRMPIKSKDILHAKFLNMIVSEYQMEVIMLAIPMIVYGVLTNVNLLFYLYMIIILLILPVIPITITSLVLAIIIRFTNSMKNKSKAMYITIILSIILMGIMSIEFSKVNNVSSGFLSMLLKANGVAESIAERFVLIKPIMNTLLNYNNIDGVKNIVIYLLESVLCYVITLAIISKIYLKGAIGATINGKVSKNTGGKNLELKDFKSKGIKKAYILKELKTLTRTPIFNIQCLITPIASPIIVMIIVISFIEFCNGMGLKVVSLLSEILNSLLGQVVILSIGQMFYMLNFNSIIAVSRESKCSKLMKYIPVKLSKQFKLKMFIGVIINIISSLLLVALYYIITHNIVNSLVIFVVLLGMNLIGEKFKLLIDIKNPKINWDSEYTMLKHNTNVMFELFYTLSVIGFLIISSILINSNKLFLIFMILILIVANIFFNRYIVKE